MKKWVVVGTLLMFLVSITAGNGAVKVADQMPPTPSGGVTIE
ncbi:hypothetical protein [Tumebacillus avium]|nr:hypothetical protein [Tumebacillus avium]